MGKGRRARPEEESPSCPKLPFSPSSSFSSSSSAMPKNKLKNKLKEKQSIKQKPEKKIDKKTLKSKQKLLKHKDINDSISQNPNPDSSDSDSDSESDSERIQTLLEPYTKDQLIDFICNFSLKDSSLYERILQIADRDISHRKIFVHGLGWDTTRETLLSIFEQYGEIEECKVVLDKNTGRAKGYGFVVFKNRKSAKKALKSPTKKVGNRVASCQLASLGGSGSGLGSSNDSLGRKIYVSNVGADADKEKLRVFFEKFGEIETGPIGFDSGTGKSRGFALFAANGKKMVAGSGSGAVAAQAAQPPILNAVAAAQNLALYSQIPSLNPMYSGLLGNPNAGLIAPMLGGVISTSQIGNVGGFGAVTPGLGSLNGIPSVLGAYGSWPGLQLGQSSAARAQGAGGSYSGYPPCMWLLYAYACVAFADAPSILKQFLSRLFSIKLLSFLLDQWVKIEPFKADTALLSEIFETDPGPMSDPWEVSKFAFDLNELIYRCSVFGENSIRW
ncbi:RNA recognition motif domain [Dillenia turbinata]|uniref:RNA recognition motif domain n=1 Tax=Dillenia turbinata TaxID=194707 RepID=A0AAN8Z731_9MAGN